MQVTRIGVQGLRAVRGDIAVESRCLLLTGPVGAGKSTVIDAIRTVVGLPTRMGNTGRDAHSPTGEWTVSATIDGRVYCRGFSRRRNWMTIEGVEVASDRYLDLVKTTVGVNLTIPDLSEFVRQSGQARGQFFASLLQADNFTLDEACRASTTLSLGAFAGSIVGPDAVKITPRVQDRCQGVQGTPAEICDRVKDAVNLAVREERDARTHYEQLHAQATPACEDLTVLKQKLEANAKRRGELSAVIARADEEAERYRAAEAMVATADRDVARQEGELNRLQGKVDLDASALIKQANERDVAHETLQAIDTQLTNIADELLPLENRKSELQSRPQGSAAARLLGESLEPVHPDLIVALWDAAHPVDSRIQLADMPKLAAVALDKLIRPWLEMQVKASSERAATEAAELAQVNAAVEELVNRRRELRHSREAAQRKRDHASATHTTMEIALKNTRDGVAKLPQMIEEAKQRRNELAAQAQKTGTGTDVELATEESAALDTAAAELRASLRTAEAVKSVAGQRERARVQMLEAEATSKVLKAFQEKLQEWRGRITVEGMERVMGPFRTSLTAVFGRDVEPGLVCIGSGRSAIFDFKVLDHRGHAVGLDGLSQGQFTLVSAAFCRALCEIMGGAKVLTLECAPLDNTCLLQVMAALPKLGFDLVVLESNRPPGIVPGATEDWQVVDCEALFAGEVACP